METLDAVTYLDGGRCGSCISEISILSMGTIKRKKLLSVLSNNEIYRLERIICGRVALFLKSVENGM